MKAKEQRNLPSTTPTPFLSRKTRGWRRGSKRKVSRKSAEETSLQAARKLRAEPRPGVSNPGGRVRVGT